MYVFFSFEEKLKIITKGTKIIPVIQIQSIPLIIVGLVITTIQVNIIRNLYHLKFNFPALEAKKITVYIKK